MVIWYLNIYLNIFNTRENIQCKELNQTCKLTFFL